MSSLNQEVQMLHHEVANGMQLFPPPINNPKDFEDTVKSKLKGYTKSAL
ncbi:2507_t:CDS:2 [Rhizophagus irregularis]|nr:2507_t:CDS:2 [Rhizophagus irregularis]